MLLNLLPRELSTIISTLLIPLIRSWETVSDAGMNGIRWGFGPRVAIADEEAALDTTPLLQSESSLRNDGAGGNHLRVMHVDHVGSTPPLPVSLAVAEPPSIHSSSLPAVIPDSGPVRSVLQSFRLSNLYRSLDRFLPTAGNDYNRTQMASQASEGAHASPNQILAPILGHLQKLKALTPESLPPYNPNFNIKSHAQILKERLLPIGKFITEHLDQIPTAKRGNLELRICRYIADEFWPLPVQDFTYLRIQEKYRNVLFKMATSGVPAAGTPPEDSPPEDASSEHARPEDAAHEDAAGKDALPGDSSSSRPLTSSPPMLKPQPDSRLPEQPKAYEVKHDPGNSSSSGLILGKDRLSHNTIDISAEEKDMNQ